MLLDFFGNRGGIEKNELIMLVSGFSTHDF